MNEALSLLLETLNKVATDLEVHRRQANRRGEERRGQLLDDALTDLANSRYSLRSAISANDA